MSVLSDKTLRAEISQGRLIPGGDPAHAKHCAYEIKAGRVTFGGTLDGKAKVIDLSSSECKTATIAPSGIAWVRSRSEVEVPGNMVGLWIQTNSLSRKGLLLLNSTLVEPGYRVYLAAHLANLGAQPVTLGPNDTIAKLVFLQLDNNADTLVGRWNIDYDAFIESLAAQSYSSFLRISEFAEVGVKRLADEAESVARERIQAVHENFEKKHLFQVFGGYALGLLLAVLLLTWLIPTLRSIDSESEERIERIVNEQAAGYAEDLRLLHQEIEKLRSAIDTSKQDGGPVMNGSRSAPHE